MRFRLRTLLIVFVLLCLSAPWCKLAFNRYQEAQRRQRLEEHAAWRKYQEIKKVLKPTWSCWSSPAAQKSELPQN